MSKRVLQQAFTAQPCFHLTLQNDYIKIQTVYNVDITLDLCLGIMLCKQILYGGKTHALSNKWNSNNQIHASDILPNLGKELLVLTEYKQEPSVESVQM
jgi:hypothetical protein